MGDMTSLVEVAAGNALLSGWVVKQERIQEAVSLFSFSLYATDWTIGERTVETR